MKQYKRIKKDDAVILFIDHQTGLNSLVRDFSPEEFQHNVLALADTAQHFKLPVILTTSFENGPNGPILPQLKTMFQDAPYIARPGQINAWDNDEFVTAVKKSGRKQLIMCGIVTDVCVAFPVLSAIEEGYDVYVSVDACGTFNKTIRYAAWNRMAQAGAQLMNWFSISAELARDWRDDPEGLAKLYAKHLPEYYYLIESLKIRK